ncbi:MAG: GntR family transcriptional regulator [Candidatus Binatia bacterium]
MSDSLSYKAIDKPKSAATGSENLSARVYQEIKGLILCNEIMPGQKLHHQELSDRLGVSRTPVREALTRLVQEGYVRLLPNRGFICKEIGMQEAEELYDLREALEAFAVEKAVQNLTAEALKVLRGKVELYSRDTRKRFTKERLLYDQEIHLEIAEIAGNETLKRTLQQVFDRIILKRKTEALYDEARGIIADQEHQRLLEAIEQRNAAGAITIIRSHIREGKMNVLSDLKHRKEIRNFHAIEAET